MAPFLVSFTPSADERDQSSVKSEGGLSYSYQVDAEVLDEGGEARSATRTFRAGVTAVEVQLTPAAGFLRPGVPAEIRALRADLDGTPRAGEGSYRIVALAAPPSALLPSEEPVASTSGQALLTEGDRLRPRWVENGEAYSPEAALRSWPDGPEVARGALAHDAKGQATLAWTPSAPGAYRIQIASQDEFGQAYQIATELLVAPAQGALPLAALLLAEQDSVPVGGTARLLVLSGFAGEPLALDFYRGGARVEHRELIAGKDPTLIERPVGEGDRGGFAVTLRVLRDHQWIRLTREIAVPWDNRELTLGFSTFRDKIRPGAKETWTVSVRGADGKPLAAGAAQLLAYMYDRSLDPFALAPAPPTCAGCGPGSPPPGRPRSRWGPGRLARSSARASICPRTRSRSARTRSSCGKTRMGTSHGSSGSAASEPRATARGKGRWARPSAVRGARPSI